VAGGDGTVNEVVNGMVHSPVPITTIPAGTANVLAMELGLGRKMERAVALLADAIPERVSVGLLRNPDPRYFLLMAGLGLDAQIIYELNPHMKNRWGKLAYWIAGFRTVGRRLPEFRATLAGHTMPASFALATRVRNYGGDLEIARSVSLLASDFEFVLFEGANSLRYLKYFTGIATNTLKGMCGVHVMRERLARFDSSTDARIYAQVDGEFAGRLPATIETVPDALTLLIPPAYRARVAPDLVAPQQCPTPLSR
jgi:diacylglycerol kinase (ATP)